MLSMPLLHGILPFIVQVLRAVTELWKRSTSEGSYTEGLEVGDPGKLAGKDQPDREAALLIRSA